VTFQQSKRLNCCTTIYESADKISARSNGGRSNSDNSKSFHPQKNAENASAV